MKEFLSYSLVTFIYSTCFLSSLSFGESIFEKFYRENGAVYPFEDLLKSMAVSGIASNFTSVQVPDGRSLQKANANFEHPRIVVGAQLKGDDQAISPAPVFLGYSQLANQIEIISWNANDGKGS